VTLNLWTKQKKSYKKNFYLKLISFKIFFNDEIELKKLKKI